MNYQSVARRLLQEHPQTMAIAIARLPVEQAGEIMKLLPSFMQADIVSRISNCGDLPEEVLDEVDIMLELLQK